MQNFTKIILLLFFTSYLPQIVAGQYRTITGTVVDESGEGLIGAKIQIKGTTIHTYSEFDGSFKIDVPTDYDVLEISSPDYVTQNKNLGASNIMNIYLEYNDCTYYGWGSEMIIYRPYDPFLSTSYHQQLKYNEANLNQAVHPFTGINESPSLSVFTEGLNSSTLNIRGIQTQKITIDQIPFYTGTGNNILEDLEISMFTKSQLIKGNNLKSGMQHGGNLDIFSAYNRPSFSSTFDKGQNEYLKLSNTFKFIQEYDGCYSRHLSINHSLIQSEGNRENSAYKKHSFTINGMPEGPGKDTEPFRFFLHFASVKKGLAGPLELNDFEKNPQMANPMWAEIGAYDNHQTGIAGVSKKIILLEDYGKRFFNNTSSLFGIWNGAERLNPFRLLNNNMFVWGGKTNFEYYKIKKANRKFEVNGGLEYYNEWIGWKTFAPNDLMAKEVLNKNNERRTYFDFFLEGKHQFNQNFYLSAGFNLNKSLVKTEDKFDSDAIDYNRERWFEWVFSPKIEAIYFKKNNHTGSPNVVIGKISHGLARIPTGSISFPETPNRYFHQPEKSWNYELGIGGTKVNLLGISFFNVEYLTSLYFIDRRNILSFKNQAIDNSYQNDGHAVHSGVELFLKVMSKHIGWYGSYNYASSLFKNLNENGLDYKGNIVPGISPHTLNTGLLLKSKLERSSNKWYYFRFNYEYNSTMPLTNSNIIFSKTNHLLQTKIGCRFSPHSHSDFHRKGDKFHLGNVFRSIKNEIRFDVHLGINNMLNQQYASNFTAPTDLQYSDQSSYFYPGAPRYIYVGVKIEFGDWPTIFGGKEY